MEAAPPDYAGKSDDDLLQLALDPNSLTPAARAEPDSVGLGQGGRHHYGNPVRTRFIPAGKTLDALGRSCVTFHS
jgi:hypothetical protein